MEKENICLTKNRKISTLPNSNVLVCALLFFEDAASYVKKEGVKIYGAVVIADKETLKILDDTTEGYSILVK